jgi:hypothetical protein
LYGVAGALLIRMLRRIVVADQAIVESAA